MPMEEQVQTESKQSAPEQERPLSEATGKLLLASIGAVSLTREGLENMLNRLVERGEQARKEARLRRQEFRTKRPEMSRRGMHNLTGSVRDAVELPSKDDIRGLQDQIAALSAQIDELSKGKTEPATPPPPKGSPKP